MLNLSRRSHREQFVDKIEVQLVNYNIESMLNRISHGYASREELERVDESITAIMNKATRKIEGLSQNISYLKIKANENKII